MAGNSILNRYKKTTTTTQLNKLQRAIFNHHQSFIHTTEKNILAYISILEPASVKNH